MSKVTDITEITDFASKAGADYAAMLDDVQTFLNRFIAYPSPEAAFAHTLWIAHAHLVEAFENTPRLAFLSPEPGSGKSRCMELTEALTPRPVLSVNSTVAYVFRKISDEAGLPTLLMDEIDAVFTNGKSDGNEDLRGLLNSGYRRGATAGRAAIRGKEIVTEEWPSFCAVALAGLNQLPDTLMTRSVVVNMKRRRQDQTVEPYRRRVNQSQADALAARLSEFAEVMRPTIGEAWPTLPDGVEDRDADIWEPLLAIAEAVGGHWPETARQVAVTMVAESKTKPATLGIRLLADIRAVMKDTDRISSIDLLEALHNMETAPWANIKGEPIDARFLARSLGKYEITTNNTITIDGRAYKGYTRQHFADAWDRYLPPITEITDITESRDEEDYRSRGLGVGGDQVILNKRGVILNKETQAEPAPLEPSIGNLGNPGKPTSSDHCTGCGQKLMAPASKATGICGRCAKGQAA